MPWSIIQGIGKRNNHLKGKDMKTLKAQIAALESQYLGKMVYHNYGQIGFGIVTGIDDRDPLKLRLRVKFTRSNTPAHLATYDTRAARVRCLLPRSVTISTGRYSGFNNSNLIKK